jgi:alpha-mannosidase
LKIHLICHTHWDREWFFTAEYTNRLLPEFFKNLFDKMERDRDYKFVLDGQIRIVMDYLNSLSENERKEAKDKLKKYATRKQLFLGPYIAQIDWLIPGCESTVRNIVLGCRYAEEFGNLMKVGWLPDNFGQCGQMPQIHRLLGIDYLALWRGIEFPEDNVCTEFTWQSQDGSSLVGSWFIDSPRNIFKIGAIPEIAAERINKEVEKMKPFLSGENVMLLDGYDQDIDPENPMDYLAGFDKSELKISDPELYFRNVELQNNSLPLIEGELLSGRYVSVFPGKLSSNVYLKLLNYNLENILTKKIEPINAFVWSLFGSNFGDEIDDLWVELITLQIHDNISGVSADPVNLRMEDRYLELLNTAEKLLEKMLAELGGYFKRGSTIAINTCIFPVNRRVIENGREYDLELQPLSCCSIDEKKIKAIDLSGKEVPEFLWDNEFYSFRINSDGTMRIKDKKTGHEYSNIGYFYDEAEVGDEYNHMGIDSGEIFSSSGNKTSVKLEYRNEHFASILLEGKMKIPGFYDEKNRKRSEEKNDLDYKLEIKLNMTRLIEIKMKIKNTSRDHKLSYTFPTGFKHPEVSAEMPFEIVQRKEYTDNSKPLPENLEKILAGARETGKEYEFPMKDFVSVKDEDDQLTVLTRGLVEYEFKDGRLYITLMRAVNCLSKRDLDTRSSDAGPIIYTPYAQCLREIEYELGLIVGNADEKEKIELIQAFHNPPLLVEIEESSGKGEKFELDESQLPGEFKVTAVKMADDESGIIVRGYNPKSEPLNLTVPGSELVNLLEQNIKTIDDHIRVKPMEIITIKKHVRSKKYEKISSKIRILSTIKKDPTIWKASPEKMIEKKYLEKIRKLILKAEKILDKIKGELNSEPDEKNYRLELKLANTEVALMELKLSALYNQKYLAEEKLVKSIEEEIEKIFEEIWEPRMKRRYLGFVAD